MRRVLLVKLRTGDDAERAEYFNIADIPPLAFPFSRRQ